MRAATPSNAAEIVVPAREALVRDLRGLERRLNQALDNRMGGLRLRLERLLRPLYGARRVISPVREELAALHEQMKQAQRDGLRGRRDTLADLQQRLMRRDPRSILRRDQRDLAALTTKSEMLAACLSGAGESDSYTTLHPDRPRPAYGP